MPVSIRDPAGRKQRTTVPALLPAPPTQAPRGTGARRGIHPLASMQVGFLGTEQGRKRQGDLEGAQRVPGTSPLPQLDWQVPGLSCLHSAEPQGGHPRTWQQGDDLLLCTCSGPHPRELCLHPKLVQPHQLLPSFLIHRPGPCPASISCKNPTMAYFQQDKAGSREWLS